MAVSQKLAIYVFMAFVAAGILAIIATRDTPNDSMWSAIVVVLVFMSSYCIKRIKA